MQFPSLLLVYPIHLISSDIFRSVSNSLDEYTEAVTSYISFCEDRCIPTSTGVSYSKDKRWFTAKLKRLRLEEEVAFKSGDKDRFRLAKYLFGKEIKALCTRSPESMIPGSFFTRIESLIACRWSRVQRNLHAHEPSGSD